VGEVGQRAKFWQLCKTLTLLNNQRLAIMWVGWEVLQAAGLG